MKVKKSGKLFLVLLLLSGICFADVGMVTEIAPGIWKIRCGEPEKIVPTAYQYYPMKKDTLAEMTQVTTPPIDLSNISFKTRARGCTVELPLNETEHLFGLGLQINSFNQRGLRKQLITNAYPVGNVGFTHAPIPFYVSTEGYGIYIDTARYVALYCGSHQKLGEADKNQAANTTEAGDTPEELYKPREITSNVVSVDVPGAQGVDIYVFAGPAMKDAVARYNLFSGGGVLPPMWGLGVKYRCKKDFDADNAIRLAKYFREKHLPIDMFGLEPMWQTGVYPCSYVWHKESFPDPDAFINQIVGMNYKLNLWEHVYVRWDSPLYKPLMHLSGDYPVWGGLVPDFTLEKTRNIFGKYHEDYLVKKGITAFKIDECDNSNYLDAIKPWGFPECSEFPSGTDGEQMHNMLGVLYQRTMQEIFDRNNKRTYGDVRASSSLAAPYSFTLYTDIYGDDDFMRMGLNAGFSGILWSPEVREASSVPDLIRRVQQACFSAQLCFNSWFLENPPWLQISKDKNNKNEFLENAEEVEQMCKKIMEIRMSLIPYLYANFAKYYWQGQPPFRALVMDYPDDAKTYTIDSQSMVGDSLLFAPFFKGSSKRNVYLPQGNWYCFWDHKKFVGSQKYEIEMGLDKCPVFVKDNSILPIAEPVEYIDKDTVFKLTVYVFGKNPAPVTLIEDDGESLDFKNGKYNTVKLTWSNGSGQIARNGSYKGNRYEVVKWVHIDSPDQEDSKLIVPDEFISDLKAIKSTVGALDSAKLDKSIQGNPIILAGKTYAKGVGVHAYSELIYNLKPEYKAFVAAVGLDEETKESKTGSVVFKVFLDDKLCEISPVLEASSLWHINVPIPPQSKQIKLVVTDAGDGVAYDHADWANAGFIIN